MTEAEARDLVWRLLRRAAATRHTDALLLREAANAITTLAGTDRRAKLNPSPYERKS